MAQVDAATLWQIFQFVGLNWGTTKACDMTQAQFGKLLGLPPRVATTGAKGLDYARSAADLRAG